MVLLRQLLGDVLRRLRLRQGRTLREVSASARVSLGYLSEVERGQKEASSELLAAICGALNTPLSQVFREVSDNFALAELQNEPVLGIPREPGLRVPADANSGLNRAGLNGQRGFVPISTLAPDEEAALEFVDDQAGFGPASGHVHDVTDMVSVLSDPGARVLRQEPHHVRQVPGHDVGQRDLLEHGPLVGAQRDPHLLQGFGRARVGDVLRAFAPDAEQLAVDGPDDIGQRDLRRRARQPEAAVGSALAADEPGPPELGQDRLEELTRYLLRASKLIGRNVSAAGRGELDRGAQRVIGPG